MAHRSGFSPAAVVTVPEPPAEVLQHVHTSTSPGCLVGSLAIVSLGLVARDAFEPYKDNALVEVGTSATNSSEAVSEDDQRCIGTEILGDSDTLASLDESLAEVGDTDNAAIATAMLDCFDDAGAEAFVIDTWGTLLGGDGHARRPQRL